jgi:hypothetical protein
MEAGKSWEIPLQAMIKANPQLKNPNVLMTGEIVYIPKMDSTPMNEAQGHKASTMSYPQAVPMQVPVPGYTMMPQQQMPYVMPHYEGPTGDISTIPPSMPSSELMTPSEPMPVDESKPIEEEPGWSMPPSAPQEQTMAEPQSPDLSVPYQQTQNPFAQFHIKSTEVLAYSEPLKYGNETLASNIPEMPPMYGGYQPFSSSYPAYQAQPAYPVKNCGCGGGTGGEYYAHPWNAYPAHPLMEMPYSPSQLQPVPSMFHYSMMPAPSYPMTGGEMYPGFAYGTAHPGMGSTYPASHDLSHSVPQAHIHQWPEHQDQEEQQDREASAEKNIAKSAGKSAGTSKKAKHASSNDVSQANSRKQQVREDRAEPKVNLPWINV